MSAHGRQEADLNGSVGARLRAERLGSLPLPLFDGAARYRKVAQPLGHRHATQHAHWAAVAHQDELIARAHEACQRFEKYVLGVVLQ